MTPLCVFVLHDQMFGAHDAGVAAGLALLGQKEGHKQSHGSDQSMRRTFACTSVLALRGAATFVHCSTPQAREATDGRTSSACSACLSHFSPIFFFFMQHNRPI